MRSPRPWLIASCALLALAALLSTSWRWAGAPARDAGGLASLSLSQRGPIDPAFCGPLQIPLPPPPIDSPFGVHLYAAAPKGKVHLLSMDEALVRLHPPPSHISTPHAASLAQPGSVDFPRQGASAASAAGGLPPSSPVPSHHETAEEDIQTVVMLLEEYRRAFGAMPMGEQNDEIVRRLQGENPRGIAVLPKTHPNLSTEGELLDRWGTPYRFHPESAWLTTVRSAGPDRTMWTHDDILSENALPGGAAGAPTLTLGH